MSEAIDRKLLEALVCPVTRGRLVWDREANELVCHNAGLAYPIQQGVPIMLPDAARRLDD
ncbi:Trm112 family protein [Roseobacter sp. HKCCA0434]|uniref:Trm112 family protein n=1 Tax=Roseobacter sp. HKCCA0434 TaxID=3079297 RepID=UPI002905C25D|nr:Trm112 family protein [Roseobacter sp. HKCCA0434]